MAASLAERRAFIENYAKKIGLDPKTALGIANAEGLTAWSPNNPNAASTVDVQNGRPFSFGDFQLNIRNGLGNVALARGIDPRDPNQWQAADQFAMDQMKAGGLGPWKGDAYAKAILGGREPPSSVSPTIGGAVAALNDSQGSNSPKPPESPVMEGLQKMAGGDSKDQPQQQPPPPMPQPSQMDAAIVQQRQQMIAQQAQQLLAAHLKAGQQGLMWGQHPYGMGLAGQIPGMTVNSTGGPNG